MTENRYSIGGAAARPLTAIIVDGGSGYTQTDVNTMRDYLLTVTTRKT
jgi:hypothetical protein